MSDCHEAMHITVIESPGLAALRAENARYEKALHQIATMPEDAPVGGPWGVKEFARKALEVPNE